MCRAGWLGDCSMLIWKGCGRRRRSAAWGNVVAWSDWGKPVDIRYVCVCRGLNLWLWSDASVCCFAEMGAARSTNGKGVNTWQENSRWKGEEIRWKGLNWLESQGTRQRTCVFHGGPENRLVEWLFSLSREQTGVRGNRVNYVSRNLLLFRAQQTLHCGSASQIIYWRKLNSAADTLTTGLTGLSWHRAKVSGWLRKQFIICIICQMSRSLY
jgi:hypothetical protein